MTLGRAEADMGVISVSEYAHADFPILDEDTRAFFGADELF